jgi:hypothetical protein
MSHSGRRCDSTFVLEDKTLQGTFMFSQSQSAAKEGTDIAVSIPKSRLLDLSFRHSSAEVRVSVCTHVFQTSVYFYLAVYFEYS